MKGQLRSLVWVIAFTLGAWGSASGRDVELPILGTTMVGTPHHLRGDLILERVPSIDLVRDFSDLDGPRVTSLKIDLALGFWSDVVVGSDLIVALNTPEFSGGFSVLEVSNRGELFNRGVLGGPELTSGCLRGRVLLAATAQILLGYDLSDPDAPISVWGLPVGYRSESRWFSSTGQYTYLVDAPPTLRVLDLQDPTTPSDLGTVSLPLDSIDAMVATSEGKLCVVTNAGSQLELVVFDATDPLLLDERSRFTLGPSDTVLDVDVEGSTLAVATADGVVRAIDVTEADSPALLWTLNHPSVRAVVLANTSFHVDADEGIYAYVRTSGEQIPTNPVFRARVEDFRSIVADGPVHVVASALNGKIASLDLSNPGRPQYGLWIDTGITRGTLVHFDGVGMVVDYRYGNAVRFVDLSDPRQPRLTTLLSGYSTGRSANAVVSSKYAAVSRLLDATGSQMESILFDCRDVDAPQQVATLGALYVRALEGEVGLFTTPIAGDGIQVLDLSQLPLITYTGSIPLDGAISESLDRVELRGGIAYVFTSSTIGDALRVIDLRDVAAPVELARLEDTVPNPAAVGFHENLMVVVGRRVEIYDVTQPPEPVLLATVDRAGGFPSAGVVFGEGRVTFGGIAESLDLMPLAPVAAPEFVVRRTVELESAVPNPFNPSTTVVLHAHERTTLVVAVHDVRGRLVRRLASGAFEAGRHSIRWDGCDDGGREVASGVYVVRASGSGGDSMQRVTLLK